MKIAFLGNFEVDYCSEVHYKKTLEKLGHEVITLQEGKVSGHYISGVLVDRNIDLFFWVHTHGWNTVGIEEALRLCKELNIPTVGYHLDLWLGIEREKDLETDSYWKIDYFFSVDQKMVDLLNSREDMPKAFFLPAGVFEDECKIGEKRDEFAYDVIFVGSRGYHPEWPYRKKLIEWLEQTYGERFAQFGGGGKGTVRGKDLNDLYASAKIVVGDTLCKDFKYPYYLSDRIFETTGRGGFIIHPYIKGIEELFNIYEYVNPLNQTLAYPDIVTYPFNDFRFLKYAIDFFLKNEDLREAVRMNGFNRTKSMHTYTQRLKHLLEVISLEQLNNENEKKD